MHAARVLSACDRQLVADATGLPSCCRPAGPFCLLFSQAFRSGLLPLCVDVLHNQNCSASCLCVIPLSTSDERVARQSLKVKLASRPTTMLIRRWEAKLASKAGKQKYNRRGRSLPFSAKPGADQEFRDRPLPAHVLESGAAKLNRKAQGGHYSDAGGQGWQVRLRSGLGNEAGRKVMILRLIVPLSDVLQHS